MYSKLNDPLLFGGHANIKFSDVFPDVETFRKEYTESELYAEPNKLTKIDLVYYLLYARYGNSTIASFDTNQFKYMVFSTMFMYGPTWEKRLELQAYARTLDPAEPLTGSKRINNVSYNPSTIPGTGSETELDTINQQYVDTWKKGPAETVAFINELVKTDITEQFVGKFKKLFLVIVQPDYPLYYETEEGALQ